MPKITHFSIKESNIFIDWFDSKTFLIRKKEKKDYGFSNVNIIFAYNGYGKSSFTALLKKQAWWSDVLWNDYKSDLKEKWKLWSLNIKGFIDNNQKEGKISKDNLKWKVIVFDKYFVERNLYIPTYLGKSAEKKKNEKFKNKLLLLWKWIKNLFEDYQKIKDEIDILSELLSQFENLEEKQAEKEVLERILLKLTEEDEIQLINKYIEDIDKTLKKRYFEFIEKNKEICKKYLLENNKIDQEKLKNDLQEKKGKLNDYLYSIKKEQKEVSEDLKEINDYLEKLWFEHLKLTFKEKIWEKEELTSAFVVKNNKREIDLKQLSEWELKAIWLALFFALLNKNQDKIKDCIVVFDDPVNSYDHKKRVKLANFIRDFFKISNNNISKVSQIFILTHDNLFYKFLNKSIKSDTKRVYMIDKSSKWSYIVKYNDKDIYDVFKQDLIDFVNKQDEIKNDIDNIEATIAENLAKLRYVVEYTIKEKIFNESSDWISNLIWSIGTLHNKLNNLSQWDKLRKLQNIYDFCSAWWLHQQDELVSLENLVDNIRTFNSFNL